MKLRLALALGVALPTAAWALETPTPSKFDPHMRTVPYSAGNRVLLEDTLERSLTITFSPKEHIALVIFGDSLANGSTPAWEGPDQKQLANQSLGNVLPLWPQKVGREDMQVITKDDTGARKVYQFELVAKPAPADDCGQDDCDDPNATYGLTFTYPAEASAEQITAWRARQAAIQKRQAEARLATDLFMGPRNWMYVAKGNDRDIAPSEISDNGRAVAMRFPGNTETPAIYKVVGDRWLGPGLAACYQAINLAAHTSETESLAPIAPNPGALNGQNDLVLVQETAFHLRLRLGTKVLDIFNCGYDPAGQDPETGTDSPDVIREVRAQ